MALVFYQPLPRGQKTVYFISPTHLPYCQMEQAIDENPHTLSCAIPSKSRQYIYVHNEISVFLSLHLTHLMYSQSHYTPVSAVKKLQYHSLKMHNNYTCFEK